MKKFLSLLFSVILCFQLSTGMANETVKKNDVEKITSEKSYPEIAEELLPTVVAVYVQSWYLDYNYTEKRKSVIGAGVVVSEQGHILTCAHLFRSEPYFVEIMRYNGDTVVAELLYIDSEKDLALLRPYYDEKVPYVSVSKTDPKIGESVIAIGHPLGLRWSFTTGVVSGLNRSLRHNQDLIQTDAVINKGNSGGPLFNRKGELLGINVLIKGYFPIANWSGQSFAVSTKEIREFLGKFKGL